MTYAEVLLYFIVGPVIILGVRVFTIRGRLGERGRWVAPLMAAIALVYTTPWDNYLVWRGVWWYGPGRVLGTIGWVPIEEYAFFVLQPLLTGCAFLVILVRFYPNLLRHPAHLELPAPGRPWGTVALVGLVTVGLLMLTGERTLYLGLILVWAIPALAALWAFGGMWLGRYGRPVLVTWTVTSLYLWGVDRLAIRAGVWAISDRYTLGVDLLGLPLEEATFFAATNLLVLWGAVMVLVPGLPIGETAAR